MKTLLAFFKALSFKRTPKPLVICPACHKNTATTYSGKRMLCLTCAYEETT